MGRYCLKQVLAVVAVAISVGFGYAQPASPPVKPPVFELKSYDLSRITWYASADLPPSSTVEQIRERGTPTTPTVTLRSAVAGGTGILFCFVQLPETLPAHCAGRITIGDIDGNDDAFWNGTAIGSTTGWGVAEYRPRMYTVPRSSLRPGINVFALRMSGPGGRATFGVKSKTLSFCLTPPHDEPGVLPADSPTSSTPTIDISVARQAILAADPTASGSLIQRKRPSFGRFGEFEHNGLPAVNEISPTRIAVKRGPSFDVSLDTADHISIVRDKNEPGVDGWHQLSRVTGTLLKNRLIYTVRQNLLYPGAVFNVEHGPVMQFRVRFPQNSGHVFPLSSEETEKVFGKSMPGLAVYGFLPSGESNTPAILAASGLSVNITQASNQIDVSLARGNGATGESRVYIFYPVGLYQVAVQSEPKSLSDIASAVRPGTDPAQVLRQWLRVGLYEPTGVDEYFSPVNNDKAIRVYQVNRYRPAAGVDLGGPLVVRPPQLDFAAQLLDYPIGGPSTSSTGVLAFSGDMHYSIPLNESSTATVNVAPQDRLHVISYDLPVPPLNERAPVKIFHQQELESLIDQTALSDLGSTASFTAVDALYKSRVQAYQAYSYLTLDKRNALAKSSAATIIPALGGHFWNQSVEPLSGLRYWYTYFIQGPYFKPYDQDWGNGLSLYGLETYVKYTGDWALPARNWDAIERLFSWFDVSDDWEWMRASNSVHGHGTGGGDCHNATYAAAVAYAKLAKGAGREADYHYGLYTLSRAALLGLNRFAYNDFARSNGFKGENSLVLGFHEGSGFLEGELDRYPWNVTSNISGNGIQTENHDLYMTRAQDAMRNYEQIFEKSYPDWWNGNYKYPFDTIYKGNSGYISLPHIYLRARLGGDSFATLSDYIERARSNRYLWWLAPPVVAEVLTKKADGIVVTEWDNAAFLGGQIDQLTDNDQRKQITLRFDNKQNKVNNIAVRLPRKPHRFQINGGPVPLTDSSFEDNELKLKLRRPGENVVTIVYSND